MPALRDADAGDCGQPLRALSRLRLALGLLLNLRARGGWIFLGVPPGVGVKPVTKAVAAVAEDVFVEPVERADGGEPHLNFFLRKLSETIIGS